ncbi:hypothetical protein ABZ208_36905 [Streptomyces sp. NPDC006208]|uniref:hypothetical protein n=1 Tax=Streptomyces sp. NPDC006208 TaxID=3156734 RepID=UPI0033B013D7
MTLTDPRSDRVRLVDLRKWRQGMELLAAEFMSGFEAVHGYPPGEHTVGLVLAGESAAAAEALAGRGLPGPLLEYYGHLGSVALPDLDNGIWIDDAASLAAQVEAGNCPNRLTGAVDGMVSVFATDGGGGMYALSHTTGCVYHLTAGALVGSTYDLDETGYRIAAEDLWSFLEHLHARLTAAVEARAGESARAVETST